MLEPASDRFHRLVYQRMMATGEPQSTSYAKCQEMHKETFAAMEKESAASEAATTAANEAAAKEKRQAANERTTRMAKIADAVEAKMKAMPSLEYLAAYNAVKREQPGLFAACVDPVANA